MHAEQYELFIAVRNYFSRQIDTDVSLSVDGDLIDVKDAAFRVPDGPGLGRDPDPDVLRDYGETSA